MRLLYLDGGGSAGLWKRRGGLSAMSHVVGEKGRVVIEKAIRDRFGVGRGWSTIQRAVGDHVEIYFIPPAHDRSLKASLGDRIRKRPPADRSWDRVREAAW
jgi:bifunctional DNA-binding transcriptional regulator/antitoxin component of YhaV-PrlF toxin-antitoxin module